MRNLDVLRLPDALAIRRARIGPHAGTVDLLLLPRGSRRRVVLVEAKVPHAQDASSKVIGQVLMYWAAALQLGLEGVRQMRRYAESHPKEARSVNPKSPNMLAGGDIGRDDAWNLLRAGRRLEPHEVGLYIATRRTAHPALLETIATLRRQFGLRIRVLVVTGHRTIDVFR